MLDFMTVTMNVNRKTNTTEISPKFLVRKSDDLMIKGRDFYAIWDDQQKLWSTDEDDATRLIDNELKKFVEDNASRIEGTPVIKYMLDSDSGSIDRFHKYCQKQRRDHFSPLDEDLVFSNTELTRDSFASKRLNYPLEKGSIEAFDKIIGTLYTEEERHKLEWSIGCIVSGDSKTIQKFMVLYGAAGTGKSTILNIIQQLFDGYYCTFDAKALGQSNNAFALESFKTNPLVAIQHDGDLSRIEDNTRLNSLVSHESMSVNEKFKGLYETRFKCFLFMGTNRPVKITDGKSGLLRRLIDVTPSGNKLSPKEYNRLMKQVKFELGAIAYHCLDVYREDPGYYDDYMPKNMMSASNDFYNFICDSYSVFKREDSTTLDAAWQMYKLYAEEAKIPVPFSKRIFKEELKNYFIDYFDYIENSDGTRLFGCYKRFKTSIFDDEMKARMAIGKSTIDDSSWLVFDKNPSIFDRECSDCLAQYATTEQSEKPLEKWEKVTTTLSDIDTSKVHYVRVPVNHIVIDFDIKDEDGNKSLSKNIEAASKWPPTYAELSKSGRGIHLHYIYTGNPEELSRIYDEDIEVKVFTGKSSLRRKLVKCTTLAISTISSGLPLKGGNKKMINFDGIKNEKMLRSLIKRHINKEIMVYTKPSIDMIYKVLEEAYNSGIGYDVSDMRNAVYMLAASSSNQVDNCLKTVAKMKFKSEDTNVTISSDEYDQLVFYDIECFSNLFLVNYKLRGVDKPVVRLINPKPSDIEHLIKFKLIGFNNRSYDNHMIYACYMGYDNTQLYNLSQRLVSNNKDEQRKAKFGEAFNLSYTDVYDFASKKQSLKKWEIELGLKHHELGLDWDKPVPEELWHKVAEYCDDDVLATEAVFDHLEADFTARQILADLANGTVNDTTNSLTGKIIFGNNKHPQDEFIYRDLSKPVFELEPEVKSFLEEIAPEMMATRHGEAQSLLPYFPGYKYEYGKSTYRDEEVGEGGCVRAKPGIYSFIALLDIMSMHPHSALMEVIFGVRFTRAFYDIVYGRVNIKHKAWDVVNTMLDGKLSKYVKKVEAGEMSHKDLAFALKIAINSVYGLTAAKFNNVFRDPRNVDNIVAKRGALFMLDLKYEVERRGFTVAHIKTDSIKIPDATREIIDFVMDFGKRYGYTFEHEATYERMCLVNDAVYIAKYADAETCEKLYGYVPGDNQEHPLTWTATGTQFQVPYVFKTLFSKEPIKFEDMCETKSVKGALYLDKNEHLPDVSMYEKELSKLEDKYKKGLLSDTTFESSCSELVDKIAEGHNYIFVGKVGQFTPIKEGCGGAVLYRKQDGKYNAATGTTGYRWLESDMVKELGKESDIDESYYRKLVDDAIESISQYGDFEAFVSDDPRVFNPPTQILPEDSISIPLNADELVPYDTEVDLPFD